MRSPSGASNTPQGVVPRLPVHAQRLGNRDEQEGDRAEHGPQDRHRRGGAA